MFDSLGRIVYRYRWSVLLSGALLFVIAGIWASGVFGSLSSGFADPASESARASALEAVSLPDQRSDVVLVYTASGQIDNTLLNEIDKMVADLPSDVVIGAQTYLSTGSHRLLSIDGKSTAVILQLAGSNEPERKASYQAVAHRLATPPDGLTVLVGGSVPITADINGQVESDITHAELFSFPALFVLLVLVIGGLVAAGLPLVTGGVAIVGALAVLRTLTMITPISVFSVTIVTMLGLGLAVDYALFIVSRYREELRASDSVENAVRRTVGTAGRTVLVSGMIVASSLAALLIFPQVYFRSMGFGGMAAAAVAVIGSLTVLPALLAVLGHRVNAAKPRKPWTVHVGRHQLKVPGIFFRIATAVMKHPVAYCLGIVAALLILGTPFLKASYGDIDYHALPETTQSRIVAELLATDFPDGQQESIDAVLSFPGETSVATAEKALEPYITQLQTLPNVDAAAVAGNVGTTARVTVVTQAPRTSAEAQALVANVRATPAPAESTVLVGGKAAELYDLLGSLRASLPWLFLTVLLVTLVALFLAFGSLVLPLKAVLMSALSLTASCGAVVWIFQDGNLASLLGFTPTGAVEPTQLVLMVVVAFALSTDYEVFLLSRVREEYDTHHDTRLAVATGLQQTAPIISGAALMLVVVIGSFSSSGITFIKMIGVGMVIAIVLDATVVRALLVPATMRLLGSANWWAPAPLLHVWNKVRLNEGGTPPTESATAPPTSVARRDRTLSHRPPLAVIHPERLARE